MSDKTVPYQKVEELTDKVIELCFNDAAAATGMAAELIRTRPDVVRRVATSASMDEDTSILHVHLRDCEGGDQNKLLDRLCTVAIGEGGTIRVVVPEPELSPV